ncbi:sulfotransferase [soil metagenome]
MIPAAPGAKWRLPTFLGIGAPKAGTTWLYQILASHPDVVMSEHRKEVHYFDLHFDRGLEWYERFFPPAALRGASAVGEFTPHYLYDPSVPARVRSVPSVDRFVLVVRNPVDRAFSHYRFRQRQDNQRTTFEEFVARDPNALRWGLYGRHLAPWLSEFDRDRFLVLVFERAVRDPDGTRRAIAHHLDLDPLRFPPEPAAPANEAFTPHRRRLYAAAVRQARWLRRHELDRLISMAKRAGVTKMVKRRSARSADAVLTAEQRARLWDHFQADVTLLEQLTGLDLELWCEREPV